MCSNDWKKERSWGIFQMKVLSRFGQMKIFSFEKKLKSDRSHKPCNVCDVNGMMNEEESFIDGKIF